MVPLQLAAATIAWDQVAPVFRAESASPIPVPCRPAVGCGATIFTAQDVVFRYRNQGQALLRGIDLQVRRGDRILLEGTSGGGKSTLANTITGLRVAESGLLLLNGLDRHTRGDAWRRQAVNVPQFHESHLFERKPRLQSAHGSNLAADARGFAGGRKFVLHAGLG